MNQDAFTPAPVPLLIPDLGVADLPINFVMWTVPDGSLVIPGERVAELLVEGVIFTLEADAEGKLAQYSNLIGESVQRGQIVGEIRSTENSI